MRFWIGLFFSNGEFHRRAFEEVLVVAVVSIFPLLILPFIASAKSAAETPFLLTATIWSAISSGQLYIYSFSLFGTIIWLCVEDVSQKTFAPRKYFVIAAILSAFLCLLVYSADPALSKVLNPVLVKTSIWIYGIYLAMYYALLVFKMLRAPGIDETVEENVSRLIRSSRHNREHGDD
jgi:hypothetical protein